MMMKWLCHSAKSWNQSVSSFQASHMIVSSQRKRKVVANVRWAKLGDSTFWYLGDVNRQGIPRLSSGGMRPLHPPYNKSRSTAMPSTTWVKEVFLLHSENSRKTWWEVCTVTWMEETSNLSNKKDRGNCGMKQKNASFSIFKLTHPAHMTRKLEKCQMHFFPICGRLLQF